jgi:hypothetical protein
VIFDAFSVKFLYSDKPAAVHAIMPFMKLLSFDVESNGLQGTAFAVGAVLVDSKGKILDEFQARCPLPEPVDPWVKQHVLPPMKDMPQTHPDARSMRDAFWEWYKPAKARADYALACNPYPVEARFLIACQDDDLEHRYFEHPFPLLDLGTLYVQSGARSGADRDKLVAEAIGSAENLEHHPRFDAWAAALVALKLLKL